MSVLRTTSGPIMHGLHDKGGSRLNAVPWKIWQERWFISWLVLLPGDWYDKAVQSGDKTKPSRPTTPPTKRPYWLALFPSQPLASYIDATVWVLCLPHFSLVRIPDKARYDDIEVRSSAQPHAILSPMSYHIQQMGTENATETWALFNYPTRVTTRDDIVNQRFPTWSKYFTSASTHLYSYLWWLQLNFSLTAVLPWLVLLNPIFPLIYM
jgi:hypothetical protein